MDRLRDILAAGETVTVEFKRCGGGIEADTYETVCSFLNRYGGDIYLGVENNGKISGVPANAAPDIVRNFVSVISNPDVLSPTTYLAPEIIEHEGKTIIHVHVPSSSEVHSYKRVIYDRVGDSDVKVTATGQIAMLYIRKQNIFTEKKVYPYIKDEHLRFDLLPRIRQMAVNRVQDHPWKSMTDAELLQSAGLIGEDAETGKRGYNLAAVMLLGRDDVILNVCPAYRTDALLRKVNLDRYDDRVIVQTNLIESYGLLMQFAEKHLWDKFYLEGDARVSLRNVIAREVLANTLIHREFTSPYFAKFVIEKDRMYTENANRAVTGGLITPENFEPNSKNPVIAAFFRNIWLADELGSGVRRLHYYVPRYSGKPPEFIDGDVFRIVVPLDDGYSFEVEDNKVQLKRKIKRIGDDCALTENAVLEYLRNNPYATQIEVAAAIGKSRRTVQDSIAGLKEGGKLKREGAKKNGAWVVERRTEHKKISNHKPLDESPDYLREQIITYIGNKRALIPLIQEALSHIQAELDKPKLITADVFSGSGIVARLLKGYSEYLLANDIEGYADTINRCYLSNAGERDAAELRREYEKLRVTLGGDLAPGFITRLYAPEDDGNIRPGERVFYTLRNAKYIDTARQAIGRMDKEIQHYFLAPLLYEASVKTNTAGVFKGFYKNSATGLGQYGGNGKNALKRITADIELPFPVFSRYDCEVCATKRLAEELAGELRGFDVVYIDPPYNQHPYGSNYFMLNLINDYQEPAEYSRVSGIPREWNRSRFNNKRSALEALSEICAAVGSKYLLISFNSEGFITRDEMEEMLSRFGDLHIYEQQYNTFRGSRNLSNRSIHLHEYLYLLRMRG